MLIAQIAGCPLTALINDNTATVDSNDGGDNDTRETKRKKPARKTSEQTALPLLHNINYYEIFEMKEEEEEIKMPKPI